MPLQPGAFSAPVAEILSERVDFLPSLTRSADCDKVSLRRLQSLVPAQLFPEARDATAAFSGLLLLLGGWTESHEAAQDISTQEGSFWHAIVHRMEPDSSNSSYWFRQVGQHPIFPVLRAEAADLIHQERETDWELETMWDPFLFIHWCEEGRRTPGSAKERLARRIQRAEWNLLFQWCADRRFAPIPSGRQQLS
jgi:hypothetical protein